MLAGTWLAEYGGDSALRPQLVRFLNDVLLSAPSILVGLFVYELVVAPLARLLRLGRRGGAGPARRAGGHPHHRGHAAACSPTPCAKPAWRWARRCGRTIRTIIWAAAGGGLLTGALLAFARITGETAPLLFTALNNQFFSLDMTKPMANLPVVIFNFALSAYDDWRAPGLGRRAADRRGRAGRQHPRPHPRSGSRHRS